MKGEVAPLVGAWIEIPLVLSLTQRTRLSLPLWERGLKSSEKKEERKVEVSLPLWERGLKYAKQRRLKWS